ncbi:EamA family transporter, partial [Aureispira]|nr:EamA family transporter [Aureispira sp.]
MGINKHYLQIHLAVLLFGGAGIFGKLIQISSGGIVLGRAFWGAFFILLIKNSFNDSFIPKTSKDLFIFCLLGVILAFHWVAFFEAIQLSSVAIGVLTFSTFPIFTSLLEPFADKEKFRVSNLILSVIT